MKPGIITTAAVMGLLVAVSAGEVFAAGRGGNGGGRGQGGSGACATGTTATTRPAGSQRRDGTFLTTGTTANGSTTRPNHGNGLQDGSRLNTTTTTAPAAAQ